MSNNQGITNLFRKINWLAKDPGYVTSYALAGLFPDYFGARQRKIFNVDGVKDKYFILSFDCDTLRDIEVVEDVHARLVEMGVTPSYAVPGELLLQGKEVYGRLHRSGVEFINHGFRSHTDYIPESRAYISTLFYDDMSPEAVREDVIKGHQAIRDVLGCEATGFRTPHFGTFQKKKYLDFLYDVLGELGYTYSTSTTPIYGMWNGSLVKHKSGLLEIPVTGCFNYPGRILDSWSFRFSPTRKFTENNYAEQFQKLVDYYKKSATPGVFNIYADPSQIYDWPIFFDCIKSTRGLVNVNFQELVQNVQIDKRA